MTVGGRSLFIVTRRLRAPNDMMDTKLESNVPSNQHDHLKKTKASDFFLLLIQLHTQDSPSVLANKITCLGYNGLKGEELITTLAGRTCLLVKITIFS